MANVARISKPAQPQPFAGDLDYLSAELEWVEARARRIAAERHAAGPILEHDEDDDEVLFNDDDLDSWRRRAHLFRQTEQGLRTRLDARLALNRQSHRDGRGPELALDRLCRLHGLDAFERNVLILGAAPGFSRRFSKAFDLLTGDRMGTLTVETAFAFAELDFAERIARGRCLVPSAPLAAADLVELSYHGRLPSPEQFLQMDLALTHWCFAALTGRQGLADDFLAFSALELPRARMADVVLPAADRQRLLSVVDRHADWLACRRDWGIDDVVQYGRGALILLYGAPGTGKTMTAHALAEHLGKKVLAVDVPTMAEARESDRLLPGLFRQARQHDALLFFDECEGLFGSRGLGNALMTLLLTELERYEGVAVLATNLPQLLDEALDRRLLVKIKFAEPDAEARATIWRHHLPAGVPLHADVDLQALAVRFDLAGGYIKNAVLMAVAAAVQASADRPCIDQAMLERAARDQLQRPSLQSDELVYPRVRLADVVLADQPRELVGDVIAAARHRHTVLTRWGIGAHLSYGKGVVTLLHGPPGTGKTLCAHAIAAELERPLRVVQAGSLRSKWVGETERNIANLFQQARAEGSVVLVDEADSFLSNREESHAAHEVTAINALLVALEQHDGVVVLATNRHAALDPALARRIGWTIALAAPDAPQRARIWQRLLPASVPVHGPLDLVGLAQRYPLTGAEIYRAVVRAALRAASEGGLLNQSHLEAAALSDGTQAESTALRRPALLD